MSRRRRLPLAVLAAGILLAIWLALTFRPAPVVPRDRDHRGITVPAGCLDCHGAGRSHERPPDHPISEACFSCHRWQS
jgi:hypothetical protein